MLKPQNIVQAAEEDFRRARRNAENAKHRDVPVEHFAFHRKHVRKSRTATDLIRLALMDPFVKTKKKNTRLIYGNGRLLLDAIRLTLEV
jgi:hypothetical protein